ncbi:MAG: hypothetical protein PHT33_09205 [bacterium]|nr:hypothetical protein [bacterium]
MKTITLTGEQANLLAIYITMTTNYRKRETEACRELGEEKNDEGMLRYPNMAANANWWEKANTRLEEIKEIIDKAPYSDERLFPLMP